MDVEEIVSPEERVALGQCFARVFLEDLCPFERLFQATVPYRIVMELDSGYQLDEDQFAAVTAAAGLCGDPFFYLSEAEASGAFTAENPYRVRHWRLTHPFSSRVPVPSIDAALYSPNGTWGVWISHEAVAFLAGTEDFANHFKRLYPDWSDRKREFEEKWKGATWYPGSWRTCAQEHSGHRTSLTMSEPGNNGNRRPSDRAPGSLHRRPISEIGSR